MTMALLTLPPNAKLFLRNNSISLAKPNVLARLTWLKYDTDEKSISDDCQLSLKAG